MDKTTLFGLIAGFLILIAALLLGDVPFHTLFNAPALLIVFGGTLTSILVSFSNRVLKSSLRAARQCFFHERFTTQDCVNYLIDIANFTRKEGALALQPFLDDIKIPFIQKGLVMITDSRSSQFIKDSLSTEIEISYRENLDHSRVFETAGGFAPTMGIIGAVIGLIHVVGSFSNPEQLANGVAEAFSATLYGVAMANLFLLPLAQKLRQRARDNWFRSTLLLEGIMSIQTGDHPLVTKEKLHAFVRVEAHEDSDNNTIHNTNHYSRRHANPANSPIQQHILDPVDGIDGVPQSNSRSARTTRV